MKLISAAIVFAILAWVMSMNLAHAGQNIIINNYQVQSAPYASRFCWGLIGCLVAHAMDEQDRQAAQGPHACNVWNGREYVRGTCAP